MSDLVTQYPVGTDVTTEIFGINDRSEIVTGTVVDYWRGPKTDVVKALIVQTETHGRLVIGREKVIDEPCGLQHP